MLYISIIPIQKINRRQNKCIIIIKMSNETLDFSIEKKQIIRQKK